MGAEPTTARSGADVAAEAWLLLSVALLAQRPVWLAAAQAEGLTPPQAISLMRLDDTAPPSLGDIARHMRCDAFRPRYSPTAWRSAASPNGARPPATAG